MNIGIFSGSFNPVHIGHLALANYLCEYEGLDEVWFMVTPHNPLKEEVSLVLPVYFLFLSYYPSSFVIKLSTNNVLLFSLCSSSFSIASCLVIRSLLAFNATYSCATPYALQQAL